MEDQRYVRKVRITRVSKEEEFMPQEDEVSMPQQLEEYQAEPLAALSSHRARWGEIGRFCLFAAAFLAPLLFLPITPTPIEANKIAVIGALIFIALISFLAQVIEERRITYPHSLVSLAVFSFVAVSALSAYFSESRVVSLWGYLRSPDSLLVIALCGLAFFLSFYFLRDEDSEKLGGLLLGGFVIATIIGLLQVLDIFIFPWRFTKTGGFNPVGSSFAWGVCMAIVIAAIAMHNFRLLSKRAGWFVAVSGCLMAAGLVVLNYQFLWLALTAITIITAAARFVSRENFRLPFLIVVAALFFALVGSRFPSIANVPGEVRPGPGPTLSVAAQSIKGMRVFTGTGPATFGIDFAQYRPQFLNQTNFWGVAFPQGHSYALTLLATGGVLGILALLFLVGMSIRHLVEQKEHGTQAAILTGSTFFLIALFFYPAFFPQLFLASLGIGAGLPRALRREISLEKEARWKSFSIFVVLLALIAFSLVTMYQLSQKYIASIYYASAQNRLATGDAAVAASRLQIALSLDGESDEYLRAASQSLIAKVNEAAQSGESDAIVQIQSQAAAAIDTAQKAIDLNPKEVQNLVNLGSVYEALIPVANGADQFAIEWYQKAAALSPAAPDIPVLVARAYIATGDRLGNDAAQRDARRKMYDDAEAQLKKSIELKADYAVPRFLLAQLYIRQGNVAEAIQKVEEIKAGNPFDAGLAFQLGLLYYQNNQTSNAQNEFERAVNLNANYSNARYFLGLIYDKKGMRSQAITQFEKILELNPENAEVKAILANLTAGKSALNNLTPPSTPPEKRSEVPVP